MTKQNKVKVTREGLEQLKIELEHRTNVKRQELKEMLNDMREKGDLRENDGYTLALEDSATNEQRIIDLQDILKNVEIIENDHNGTSKVSLGSTVSVHNGEDHEFVIVGDTEANPLENKISHESPLGKALVGKAKGDKVTIETPKGKIEYEIRGIK